MEVRCEHVNQYMYLLSTSFFLQGKVKIKTPGYHKGEKVSRRKSVCGNGIFSRQSVRADEILVEVGVCG